MAVFMSNRGPSPLSLCVLVPEIALVATFHKPQAAGSSRSLRGKRADLAVGRPDTKKEAAPKGGFRILQFRVVD